ncbi:nucleotide exchange factor GrpE [Candidatus Berkelbacteria bacterium]|nr:nucleotide exchange factor GrpE [Candidatus Berkelbacteria bacterium]
MANDKKTQKQKQIQTESVPKDQYLRLAADYANLERRVQEERGQLFQVATASFLEKLFPIFDNFYRSSSHAPSISGEMPTVEQWQKIVTYLNGVTMIEKQLESALAEAGLKKIQTKGEQFDLNLHEAISYEDSSEFPADTIIDEIEAGWILGEKVLKPAKVRVSKG